MKNKKKILLLWQMRFGKFQKLISKHEFLTVFEFHPHVGNCSR